MTAQLGSAHNVPHLVSATGLLAGLWSSLPRPCLQWVSECKGFRLAVGQVGLRVGVPARAPPPPPAPMSCAGPQIR